MALISIAYGDGIGHEIMDAALMVMREAGANLEVEAIQIGKSVYKMGSQDGVLPSAWESLERTRVLLKGPVIRPEDKKNVTETICDRFGVEIGLRVTEQCYMQPEISAIGYASKEFGLFEPLQDDVPKLAWKNRAHPGAMILASAMMLEHIGQKDAADAIRHALQATLSTPIKKLRTNLFAELVVEQLLAVPVPT
jgi:isocitrate/isopropylmalate dehydrogenase